MSDYNVGLVYKEDLSDLSRLSKGEYVIAAEPITIIAGIATISIEAGDWIVKTKDGLAVITDEE